MLVTEANTWDDKKLHRALFCGGVVVDESEREVRDWSLQPPQEYADTFYLALRTETFIETFFKLSESVILPIACVRFTNHAISEYKKPRRLFHLLNLLYKYLDTSGYRTPK